MPVAFERRAGATVTPPDARRERRARSGATLFVGLVNNMPDAALRATERQFSRLLQAAAGAIDVRLRLYALPEVPRSAQARAAMAARYRDADEIFSDGVDALIVTGAEPVAADLAGRALLARADRPDRPRRRRHAFDDPLLPGGPCRRPAFRRRRPPRPAVKCSGVFAFETRRAIRWSRASRRACVAAFAPQRLDRAELDPPRLPGSDRRPDIGVDAFVGERRACSSSCRAIPNMTPTRSRGNIAATSTVSFAARRRSRRFCRSTTSARGRARMAKRCRGARAARAPPDAEFPATRALPARGPLAPARRSVSQLARRSSRDARRRARRCADSAVAGGG